MSWFPMEVERWDIPLDPQAGVREGLGELLSTVLGSALEKKIPLPFTERS